MNKERHIAVIISLTNGFVINELLDFILILN